MTAIPAAMAAIAGARRDCRQCAAAAQRLWRHATPLVVCSPIVAALIAAMPVVASPQSITVLAQAGDSGTVAVAAGKSGRLPAPATASSGDASRFAADAAGAAGPPPPDLATLARRAATAGPDPVLPAAARLSALREAASAQGMEGGLAYRGHAIASALLRRGTALDAIWNFGLLMLPGGDFLLAPPVVRRISGAQRLAMPEAGSVRSAPLAPLSVAPARPAALPAVPSGLGSTAAVAAATQQDWRILQPARLVTSAPDWRDFLIRVWPAPAPLPAVFMPRSPGERTAFDAALTAGWQDGLALADAIHDEDIDRLTTTWLGMIEWHRLVLAGVAVPPRLDREERAVAGGGASLQVGETRLTIGEAGRLNPVAETWRPLEARGAAAGLPVVTPGQARSVAAPLHDPVRPVDVGGRPAGRSVAPRAPARGG